MAEVSGVRVDKNKISVVAVGTRGIAMLQFPLVGANGSCGAPTYSFVGDPTSGVFLDTGTGAVRVSQANCLNYLEVGPSNVLAAAATGFVVLDAGYTAPGSNTGLIVRTNNVEQLRIGSNGAWNLHQTGGGSINDVITSQGAGAQPIWQAIGATPILAANGTCAAPSYSFLGNTASGLFFDGATLRLGYSNCTDFIELGASINVVSTGSAVTVTGETGVLIESPSGDVDLLAAGAVSITASSSDVEVVAATTLTLRNTSDQARVQITGGGDLLFRTNSLARLTIELSGAWLVGGSAGAAGQAIVSGGAGVAPSWATVAGGMTGFATPTVAADAAAATGGATTTAIRSDAKLQVSTAAPTVMVDAAAASAGVAATLLRSDAKLQLSTGTPTVAADAAAAAAGTANSVLRSDAKLQVSTNAPTSMVDAAAATAGVAATLLRSDAKLQVSTGAPSVAADAAAAAAGTANSVLRSDAKLQVSTGIPTSMADAAAATIGTANSLLRSDAKLQVATGTPTSPADAAVATAGAASTLLRSDAKLQVSTAVPVANSVDATGPSVGVATTLLRSDAKLQVFTAAPSTAADAAGPTAGVAASVLRSDAKLQVSTAAPAANSVDAAAPSVGVATSLLRSDAKLQVLTAAPSVAADAAVASAGVASSVLRSDAKLQVSTGTPVTVAQANADGVADTLARSDHVHRTVTEVEINGVVVASRPTINFLGGFTGADDVGGDRVNVTSAGAVLVWGASSVGLAVDTRVMPPGYIDGTLNTQSPRGWVSPRAGTISNLYVRHNTANGNGNSVVYTLRVNGVASALTATLATGAIGSASDTTNSVTIAAGDLIELTRTIAVAIGSAALDALCAAQFD